MRAEQRVASASGRPSPDPAPEDFWLRTPSGSVLATRFWPAAVAPASVGVVLVPGIAHEWHTMHLGLLTLGRELADAGMPALVIDLEGTANGSGDLDQADLSRRWADDVRCAVAHLRGSGLRHVAVVGVRLGALVAVEALASDPVDLVVLWAPVLSGRRYVRELKMIHAAASDAGVGEHAGLTVAGYRLPQALLDQIQRLDVRRVESKPAGRVCLVDGAERLAAIDLAGTPLDDVPVDRVIAPGTDDWLYSDADGMTAPFADLSGVVDAIGSAFLPVDGGRDDVVRADVGDAAVREEVHRGVGVRETLVRIGPAGLAGVLSEPETGAAPGDGGPALLAVTAVGPGRLFVDLARSAASQGRTCLRFDLAGFGSSPRRPGHGWADFYDPGAGAEIAAAVDHLVALGHRDVEVVGFCAGAWSAVQMPPHPAVRRIVGINLQLFIRHRLLHRRPWPDLPPVKRLLAAVGQDRNVRRVVKRVQFGHPLPSPTVRWIRRQRRAGVDVVLAFADEDRGYRYYLDRVERRFRTRPAAGPVVLTYRGMGHLPSGPPRDRMIDDVVSLGVTAPEPVSPR